MAEYKDREHYIPLRVDDLVTLLCTDKGLNAEQGELFRQFCRLVTATFHFEYHDKLKELKNEYAPFDPDRVTATLKPLSDEARQQKLDALFEHFGQLMERANYKKLERADLEKALEGASDWGVNMEVDLNIFEKLAGYVRGDVLGTRTRRRWRNLWRLETVKVPVFQRLVMMLKLKPNKRVPRDVDTKVVYIKLFKDIPKMDIEMLLPGARVQIPKLQWYKMGGSILGGLAFIVYKVVMELTQIMTFAVAALWGPIVALLGYGYKQFAGYQTTRQAYSLQLNQSLYYQNLDNNAGVLFHVLDEAEEQECREAILAYYYLWRYDRGTGWRAPDLDDYVEMDLERLANLKVDFEIEDALAKLERLHLVEKVGENYRAVPLQRALEILDDKWDNIFPYANALRS
jgi:hypothetical protein